MSNRFERMNQYISEDSKGNDNEKDNEIVNKNDNEIVDNGDKEKDKEIINNKDNEIINKKPVKTTRFVESLLQKKKEEKILVGFRLDKSVSDTIDQIVEQNNLKKSEFVNEILRKALGL